MLQLILVLLSFGFTLSKPTTGFTFSEPTSGFTFSEPTTSMGSHESTVTKASKPQLQVELVGGATSNEGNVMINGRHVCDEDWDREEASVVCRMLGFAAGEETLGSEFGYVHQNNFIMNNFFCSGLEQNLIDCLFKVNNLCSGDEAAGVRCTSKLEEYVYDIRGENNFALLQSWGPCYAIQFEVKLKSLSCDFKEIISFRPIEHKDISIPKVSVRLVGEKFELKVTNDDDETTFPFQFSGDSSDLLNEWKRISIVQEDIHDHEDADSHHQVQFTVTFGEETLTHSFGHLLKHVNVGVFLASSEDHAEGQIRNLQFIEKPLVSDEFFPRILTVVKRFPEEYKLDILMNIVDYPLTSDSELWKGLFQVDSDDSGSSPFPGVGLISKSGDHSGRKYICVKINEADSCEDSNLVSSEPLELSRKHNLILKQVKEEGSDNYLFSATLDGTLLGTRIIPSSAVSSNNANNVSFKLFKNYMDQEGNIRDPRIFGAFLRAASLLVRLVRLGVTVNNVVNAN